MTAETRETVLRNSHFQRKEDLDSGSETILFKAKFFEMREEEFSKEKRLERTRKSRSGRKEGSKCLCARWETEQNVEKDQTPPLHSSNTNSADEIQPDLRLERPIEGTEGGLGKGSAGPDEPSPVGHHDSVYNVRGRQKAAIHKSCPHIVLGETHGWGTTDSILDIASQWMYNAAAERVVPLRHPCMTLGMYVTWA